MSAQSLKMKTRRKRLAWRRALGERLDANPPTRGLFRRQAKNGRNAEEVGCPELLQEFRVCQNQNHSLSRPSVDVTDGRSTKRVTPRSPCRPAPGQRRESLHRVSHALDPIVNSISASVEKREDVVHRLAQRLKGDETRQSFVPVRIAVRVSSVPPFLTIAV